MPNVQTHLAAASILITRPSVREIAPWLFEDSPRSAFMLGAISPDVRGISGHTREQTHFFTIPPEDDRSPDVVMLGAWPQLGSKGDLTTDQKAFIAGYMTHIIMDQVWVEQVVMKGLFLQGAEWGIRHPNWRLYAILMTHMEYNAASHLASSIVGDLQTARPVHWMPFIKDRHLAEWRDRIAGAIQEGGARLISTPLVKTCGMTMDQMEAIILSAQQMETQAFATIPRQRLLDFETETASRSEAAILNYFNSTQ
jgi:hypothetical protein